MIKAFKKRFTSVIEINIQGMGQEVGEVSGMSRPSREIPVLALYRHQVRLLLQIMLKPYSNLCFGSFCCLPYSALASHIPGIFPQILVSGPSAMRGWNEFLILATSDAHKCPKPLLYHSGEWPLRKWKKTKLLKNCFIGVGFPCDTPASLKSHSAVEEPDTLYHHHYHHQWTLKTLLCYIQIYISLLW